MGGRYIADDTGNDTFNLYDVGALAHADLIRALRQAGTGPVTSR